MCLWSMEYDEPKGAKSLTSKVEINLTLPSDTDRVAPYKSGSISRIFYD